MRRLMPGDFEAVWELGAPHIDARLKPDIDRARASYQSLLSQAGTLAEGEFYDDFLAGVVIASSCDNAYAKKGHARMDIWIGSVALLDRAIAWWEGRPMLRALVLQFPNDVRPGVYRMLKMRGFERSGDLNVLWR